ncbi:hypothetical protein Mapa_008782 [Marchantia paleacea]|nr:hypothetical protein Mapa_008782 [Marchantia paleacea]
MFSSETCVRICTFGHCSMSNALVSCEVHSIFHSFLTSAVLHLICKDKSRVLWTLGRCNNQKLLGLCTRLKKFSLASCPAIKSRWQNYWHLRHCSSN